MRIFLAGFLAAYLVVCFPAFAVAEPQIEIDLKPSKATKEGETCYFLVQLTWRSREGDYRFTRPELTLDNLKVEAAGEANETFQKEGKEWKRKLFRFELKPIRKGKAKIRPFRIAYLEPVGQISGHFEIEALELKVSPDNTRFYRIGFMTIGLLTVVGGVLGGWGLLRRRRKKDETMQSSVPSLEERTLAQLTANPQQLFEAGKIFRAYLSEKYSLFGGIRTGRETLLTMEKKVSSDELKTLRRIFDTLEERQYSASPRPREEGTRLYSEMVRYIEGKKVI